MQRDETKLAGMGRRPGDDDAARLEERTEQVVARTGAKLDARGRGSIVDLDQCIDRDRPAIDHDERIEIDGHDVGPVMREPGEADERRRDRRAVDRGLAAEGPEQLLRGEIVEEIAGVEVGEGDEAEGHVAQSFGEHSPDAEHDARTELRIAHQSRDELTRAAHHRRDQQLDRAVVRAGGGEKLDRGGANRGRVAQSEPDEAPLRLVRDGAAAQFDDHRVPDRVGTGDRPVGFGRHSFVENGNAVTREEVLRRGFREGRHGGRG